jgi:hypothetical protein
MPDGDKHSQKMPQHSHQLTQKVLLQGVVQQLPVQPWTAATCVTDPYRQGLLFQNSVCDPPQTVFNPLCSVFTSLNTHVVHYDIHIPLAILFMNKLVNL